MKTFARNIASIAVASTLSVAAATTLAQVPAPATGSVHVTVSGERGGAAGAKVTVTRLDGADQPQTMTTGSNGAADFTGLREGNYEVTVFVDGKRANSYVRVGRDRPAAAPFDSRGFPALASAAASPDALLASVEAASAACDRQAYDLAVQQLQYQASIADTNVRDLTKMAEDYERLSGYQPNLGQLRAALNDILRRSLTGRRGATGQVQQAGADVDSGLRYLYGYVEALERLEKARERQRAFNDAVNRIPPFGRRCSLNLDQRIGLQLALSGEVGLIVLSRPQLKMFRSELGGVIKQLGVFRPDSKDATVGLGGSIGTRFDAPFLGADKKIGVELRGWYKDAGIRDGVGQIDPPGGGGTIGLFSPTTMANPFGGYFTGSPLTDVRYRGDFQSYGGEVQVQTWWQGSGVTFMPYIGLRVGHNDVDERISAGIGMPAFATFDQKNTINDTFVGPTLGLRGRYELSGGLYTFGGVSLGLDYHNASGKWQTFVPSVDTEPRSAKLSNDKFGVSVGAEFGIGMQWGGLSAQVSVGASYYSASPYLQFKDADGTTTGTGGPEIGFGAQTDYRAQLQLRYSF